MLLLSVNSVAKLNWIFSLESHLPTQGTCRGLACTNTRICFAANLCLYINQPITFRDLPINSQFQTLWHHPDMCNQGDAVGSTWIWNFQPMRRLYVTRTSDNIHQASLCTWPMVEQFGYSCKQGITCWLRPCIGRWGNPSMTLDSERAVLISGDRRDLSVCKLLHQLTMVL